MNGKKMEKEGRECWKREVKGGGREERRAEGRKCVWEGGREGGRCAGTSMSVTSTVSL